MPFFSPSSKSFYYHRNTKIPTERRGKLILRARWHTISKASLATCGENNENWNTLYLRLEGRAGRSAHRWRWGKASMHEVNG